MVTSPADNLFPGFAEGTFNLGEATLYARIGGRGPPLVLLHGYPQTHAAWHRIAPGLARQFLVVVPDLRGYGLSSCPPSDNEHRPYAKRTMAADIADLMGRLGYESFLAVGHDRGAMVAFRLALDRPSSVRRLVLIDTMTAFDVRLAERHGGPRALLEHTSFAALLAQPAPIPEALIGSDPLSWLEARFERGGGGRSSAAMDPRARARYLASLSDPERIHANCEDFRAGASCDIEDDAADRAHGRTIAAPTLVVAASDGLLAGTVDPLGPWRAWCRTVRAATIECGHFVAEECPEALLAAVLPFLTSSIETETSP